MTWRNGKSSCTAARKTYQEGEPAYDSSPCCMAAHWSRLIAPVPESVSRSTRTSSAWRLKRFSPAASIARRRSSRVVIRIGSTEWIRNGSMIVCQRSIHGRYASGWARTGPSVAVALLAGSSAQRRGTADPAALVADSGGVPCSIALASSMQGDLRHARAGRSALAVAPIDRVPWDPWRPRPRVLLPSRSTRCRSVSVRAFSRCRHRVLRRSRRKVSPRACCSRWRCGSRLAVPWWFGPAVRAWRWRWRSPAGSSSSRSPRTRRSRERRSRPGGRRPRSVRASAGRRAGRPTECRQVDVPRACKRSLCRVRQRARHDRRLGDAAGHHRRRPGDPGRSTGNAGPRRSTDGRGAVLATAARRGTGRHPRGRRRGQPGAAPAAHPRLSRPGPAHRAGGEPVRRGVDQRRRDRHGRPGPAPRRAGPPDGGPRWDWRRGCPRGRSSARPAAPRGPGRRSVAAGHRSRPGVSAGDRSAPLRRDRPLANQPVAGGRGRADGAARRLRRERQRLAARRCDDHAVRSPGAGYRRAAADRWAGRVERRRAVAPGLAGRIAAASVRPLTGDPDPRGDARGDVPARDGRRRRGRRGPWRGLERLGRTADPWRRRDPGPRAVACQRPALGPGLGPAGDALGGPSVRAGVLRGDRGPRGLRATWQA